MQLFRGEKLQLVYYFFHNIVKLTLIRIIMYEYH